MRRRENPLNQITTLLNARKYEEAIQACDQLINQMPNTDAYFTTYAYNTKGDILLKQFKKYEEAIQQFDKVLEVKPDDSTANLKKSGALNELGLKEEALQVLDNAIRLKPNYHYFYHQKGEILLDLGRKTEALESFNRAIEIEPNHSEFYSSKGLALTKLGQKEEAIKAFNRSIEINPSPYITLPYHCKGLLLAEIGQKEEAIQIFSGVLEKNSNSVLLLCDRAKVYHEMGKEYYALKDIKKASQLVKEGKFDYNTSEKDKNYIKDTLEGLSVLQDPDNLLVLCDKAKVYHERGKEYNAFRYFRKASQFVKEGKFGSLSEKDINYVKTTLEGLAILEENADILDHPLEEIKRLKGKVSNGTGISVSIGIAAPGK